MSDGGGRRRRTRAPRRKPSARPFWGDPETAAGPVEPVEPVDHPTALIDSLGVPPFPKADVAPHYFALVYGRATGMALALAAGQGIVVAPEPDADVDADAGPQPA